jgi:hypothetical protein
MWWELLRLYLKMCMAIRLILRHFQDPIENNMLITVDHLYKTSVEGQLHYPFYKWNEHLSNFLIFVIMQMTVGDSLRWPRDNLYPLKLALTSPTSGGRSVEFVLFFGLQTVCMQWLKYVYEIWGAFQTVVEQVKWVFEQNSPKVRETRYMQSVDSGLWTLPPCACTLQQGMLQHRLVLWIKYFIEMCTT